MSRGVSMAQRERERERRERARERKERKRGAELRQAEALRKSFSFCANKLDYSITCLYPANR